MEAETAKTEKGVRESVRAFIVENFLFGADEQAPDDTTSFLETGIIDSTGILELVHFVETQYAIEVGDEEMMPENLDSLANISAFVAGKLAVAAT